MAKKTYIGVGGKARAVTDIYVGVNGKARRVKKAYVGDANGKAKEVYLACHRYTTAVTAPTCTAQGYTTYTCTLCGHTYKDNYTAAKGHSYTVDSGVQYSAATCIAKRKNYKQCSCGYNPKSSSYLVEVGSVNASNHSSKTSYAAKSPTCTANGNYAYSYCSGCQKYYNSSGTETTWTSINRPATGHDWSVSYSWSNDKSSCTATRACGNDSAHNVTSKGTVTSAVTKAATCIATGTRTHTATFSVAWATDQTTTSTIAIDSTNHSGSSTYGGTSGVHTKYSCCDATISSSHSYTVDSGEQYSAATCTAKRKNYKKCACGYNPKSASYLVEVGSVNSSNHTGSVVNGGTSGVHTKYSCCGATVSTSHAYTVDSGVQYTAATCTAARQNYKKCSCGYNPQNSSYVVSTGSVNSNNHTGSEVNGGTSGVHTKYSCCGATIKGSSYHSYTQDSGVQYSAATCIAKRKNYKQCSCGYNPKSSSYLVEVGSVNASNHASNTKVNGGTSGVHSKWQCCGATYQGSSYHSYTVDSGVQYQAATCTTNRKNYMRCACGYNPKSASYIVEVANTATGHDWNNDPCICSVCNTTIHGAAEPYATVAATCTAAGQTGGSYCSDCNRQLTAPTVIPALNHPSTKTINYVEEDCTNDGYSGDTYCNTCKTIIAYGSNIPAPGHDWDPCECSRCSAVNHGSAVAYPEVAATCTSDGWTGGSYCSDCGQVFESRERVPALNHPNTGIVNNVAPECTSTGYTGDTYCYTCRSIISSGSTIPATGHSYSNSSDCICNTCGEDRHEYDNWDDCYCNRCGESRHEWDSDCVCVNCGETNHHYVCQNDGYDPPDCTTKGKEDTYKCTNCGDTYGGGSIPAPGHDWDSYPYYDPCKCSRCGVVIHSWEDCTCADCEDHDDSWIDDECYCSGCGEYFHQCTVYDCTCEHCGATDHVYNNGGDCIYGCGAHDDEAEGGGGGNDECLIASTPILMSDGTEKAISEVRAGDMVKSWDLDNNTYIDVKVLGAYCTGKAADWTVHTFDNGQSITVYNNHRIFCKENNGVKGSDEWRAGLTALTVDGVETKYEDVETRHDETTSQRYTMLTENNLYFANGILCGHHSKSKYKFFTKGWLKATPEEIAHYATTAGIYEDMDKALTNEEYLKQAAPLREQLLKAKEAIRVHRHEIKKIDRDVKKRGRDRIAQKGLFDLDNRRKGRVVEARHMKADSKSLRRELDELKTKFGITTKSKYQIWKETYDLDMEYLRNKK